MRHKAAPTVSVIALLSLLAVFFIHLPASFPATPVSAKQPVIIELFTSEGCSSCPPADSLLKKLSEEQPFPDIEIIVLEEHVDYWNHQGWFDPYSSADFTQRQNDYAAIIPKSSVYTPQAVVDGRTQLVGGRADELAEQIRCAASYPKARLLFSPSAGAHPHSLSFDLRLASDSAPLPQSSLDLYVAVTEKDLHANPSAGENSGAALEHSPIVRRLKKVRSVHPPLAAPVNFSVDLRDNWNRGNLTVVAFLVDPRSRQILAAGSAPVSH